MDANAASNKQDFICALGIFKSYLKSEFKAELSILIGGKESSLQEIVAPHATNGSAILFIGLLDRELSPIRVQFFPMPAK